MFSLLKKRKIFLLSFFRSFSTPPPPHQVEFDSLQGLKKKKKVNKARKGRTRRGRVWIAAGWEKGRGKLGLRSSPAQEEKLQRRKYLETPAETKSNFLSPGTERIQSPCLRPQPHTSLRAAALACAQTRAGRAQEPRGGPGETRPHLGWRPKSSRGSWALSSHARLPQFAGAQRVVACSSQGIPAPPGPPGAGGWGRGRESPLPASFGWGQEPSPSACRSRELCSPGWTLTPARRPPFWEAAVMDVRWPAGHRQRAEALITGLRREPRGERDLHGQALWSAFIIHEKQSCLGQTPGRPYSPGDPTTPSPPRRLPSAP